MFTRLGFVFAIMMSVFCTDFVLYAATDDVNKSFDAKQIEKLLVPRVTLIPKIRTKVTPLGQYNHLISIIDSKYIVMTNKTYQNSQPDTTVLLNSKTGERLLNTLRSTLYNNDYDYVIKDGLLYDTSKHPIPVVNLENGQIIKTLNMYGIGSKELKSYFKRPVLGYIKDNILNLQLPKTNYAEAGIIKIDLKTDFVIYTKFFTRTTDPDYKKFLEERDIYYGPRKVKNITADGKIYEISKRIIPVLDAKTLKEIETIDLDIFSKNDFYTVKDIHGFIDNKMLNIFYYEARGEDYYYVKYDLAKKERVSSERQLHSNYLTTRANYYEDFTRLNVFRHRGLVKNFSALHDGYLIVGSPYEIRVQSPNKVWLNFPNIKNQSTEGYLVDYVNNNLYINVKEDEERNAYMLSFDKLINMSKEYYALFDHMEKITYDKKMDALFVKYNEFFDNQYYEKKLAEFNNKLAKDEGLSITTTISEVKKGERYLPSIDNSYYASEDQSYYVNGEYVSSYKQKKQSNVSDGYTVDIDGYNLVFAIDNSSDNAKVVDFEATWTGTEHYYVKEKYCAERGILWCNRYDERHVQKERKNKRRFRQSFFTGSKGRIKSQMYLGEAEPTDLHYSVTNIIPVEAAIFKEMKTFNSDEMLTKPSVARTAFKSLQQAEILKPFTGDLKTRMDKLEKHYKDEFNKNNIENVKLELAFDSKFDKDFENSVDVTVVSTVAPIKVDIKTPVGMKSNVEVTERTSGFELGGLCLFCEYTTTSKIDGIKGLTQDEISKEIAVEYVYDGNDTGAIK